MRTEQQAKGIIAASLALVMVWLVEPWWGAFLTAVLLGWLTWYFWPMLRYYVMRWQGIQTDSEYLEWRRLRGLEFGDKQWRPPPWSPGPDWRRRRPPRHTHYPKPPPPPRNW